MIHAVEELPNVTLEDEARARAVPPESPRTFFKPRNPLVGAVAHAAGKGGRDERFLEDRVQDRNHGVVQHPVPHRRFVDVPLLRVADVEALVRAVLVGLVFQLAVEAEDVLLKMPLEPHDIGLIPFSPLEGIPC